MFYSQNGRYPDSLDQEMTEIVVEGIKQYPGKIILIAHQVVSGKFDKVINV